MPRGVPRDPEARLRRQEQYKGSKVLVKLTGQQHAFLKAEALRQGKSKAAILREAFLREYPAAGATEEVPGD